MFIKIGTQNTGKKAEREGLQRQMTVSPQQSHGDGVAEGTGREGESQDAAGGMIKPRF